MTTMQLDQLFENAEIYMDTCATRAARDWGIGTHHEYKTNPDTGMITWSNHGKPKLLGEYRIIGSHVPSEDSFRWAWTDPHIPAHLLTDAESVRRYGEANGIHALTDPQLDLTLEGGWQLAAVASLLVRADLVHLMMTPGLSTFLGVRNLRPA